MHRPRTINTYDYNALKLHVSALRGVQQQMIHYYKQQITVANISRQGQVLTATEEGT